MPSLPVTIVRFVDETQPGIVECEFTDVYRRVHRLVDKVPIFSAQVLWSDSSYPQSGSARCQILEQMTDATERELVRITIARPDSMETVGGKTEFTVESSQISADPVPQG